MFPDDPDSRLFAELTYSLRESEGFGSCDFFAVLPGAMRRLEALLWPRDGGIFGESYRSDNPPITFRGRALAGSMDMGSCWVWNGKLNKYGYATCPDTFTIHRALYKVFFPELKLSKDDQLHHLCENKRCINPYHLQAMSDERHREIHGIEEDDDE